MAPVEFVPLAPFTSFGVESTARYFSSFKDSLELEELLDWGQQYSLLILGGGSNLLLTRDFDGLVLKNEISGIIELHEDNEYVYVKNNSKTDGGVYRYFNGKYAQGQDFGGMIGFVLNGKVNDIKDKIQLKLKDPFDVTPEGDLQSVADNSIENNDFTFTSTHVRKSKNFLIYHILFRIG